jgi:hypothetical protein
MIVCHLSAGKQARQNETTGEMIFIITGVETYLNKVSDT